MEIRTISDSVWNTLCIKPFIFVGFHEYKTKVAAIAVSDEDLCHCRLIENSHSARQKIFASIHENYPGAPIAVFNGKTKNCWANILAEKAGEKTELKIVLKGSPTQLEKWQNELLRAMKNEKNLKFSPENPVQFVLP
ncbi:MAG: hypothetical protein LBN94_00415 [Puniceicoccales bacterium]|jgi:hypothetical protein|nr:hypothetical protein [Puniceicoccales bacterium]